MLQQAHLEQFKQDFAASSQQAYLLYHSTSSPDAWVQLAQLPPGFIKLCLSKTMTNATISFLINARDWTIGTRDERWQSECKEKAVSEGKRLLRQQAMTSTERLLINVMMAYNNEADPDDTVRVLKELYTHGAMAHLQQQRGSRSLSKDDFVVWSCMVLASASDEHVSTKDAAQRMLSYIQVDAESCLKLERMFLPLPNKGGLALQ